MSVYFFHITEGAHFTPDDVGVELPDMAAVQAEAIESAGALIAEAMKKGELDYEGRFDVDDDRGAKVLSLTFGCPVRIDVPGN